VTVYKGVYSPEQNGARCDLCPLRSQGASVIPPTWGSAGKAKSGAVMPIVPVAFVASAPGMMDVKKGEHLAAHADVKLGEMLWNFGVTRGRVALITSALLCRPEVPDTKGRKRYDLKNWMAWWRRENALRRKFQQPEMANPFACCAPRLEFELNSVESFAQSIGKTAAIMPLDSFALAAVQGQPGKSISITKYRGSVIEPKEPQ